MAASRRSYLAGCLVLGVVLFNDAQLLAVGPSRTGLYLPPRNAYILDPGETPVALTFGSAAIADVQAQLDAARAENPDAPIVLTLYGTYNVLDAPLTLPSETSLVLYGTVRASRRTTASSLIAIDGQRKVAIAGGHLDGRRADLTGISVSASSKVNIDDVTITNTGRDGIVLSGTGSDTWDQGSAITRCEVTRAGGNGITVDAITQALVLDSYLHGNAGTGIQFSGTHGSIVNNTIRRNDIGILADAHDNLIADNALEDNRHAGLQLTDASANTPVLRNVVARNSPGIDLDGSGHLVYANDFRNNSADLVEHAGGSWIVPRGQPLAANANQYFYPPTIDNPHSDPIMNGRNRTDITIDSADFATIGEVQQAYDAARQQSPEDVLVLHMTGDFELDGGPLTLGSNTVMLLDGMIHVTSTGVPRAITSTNPVSFLSISGGTIDCGGRVMEGLVVPSATMANIDGLTVTHCGEQQPRSTSNAIHFQRGGGYNILRGNRVDITGGRCIWTQQPTGHYILLENHTSHCNQDGIDFDSSTSNSVAIGNVSVDNLRYGIFIEQSDALNTAYGNVTTTAGLGGSTGHGIGIFNNGTTSGVRNVTDRNTVFSNTSDTIANGLRVGSGAVTGGRAETAHSFLFNNVVLNSAGDGILFDTHFERSVENYFSQTVLVGNRTDLNSHPTPPATPPDFFNPASAIDLALKQAVVASSTADGSDPANAVDGLAFTSWVAGLERQPSLTIDLGAPVDFRRVTLKAGDKRAIVVIAIETSNDGVTFTPVAVTGWHLERYIDVKFPLVTARYVRVRIEATLSGPVCLDEVAVHPQ